MAFTIEDAAVTQQMNKLWGMPSIGCKYIILCFSLTNRLEEYVEEREGKIHDLQSKYVFFVIVEVALLILWNFILENVNLRIKGTRRLILPFMFVVNVIL